MRILLEKEELNAQPPEAKKAMFLNKMLFLTIEKIKDIAQSGIFKHPTGTYANSISGYVLEDEIVVYSSVRYARAIEFGVQPHQMWYLLNKTIPIKVWAPYATEPQVIFRKATFASLMAGGWYHPGTEGKYVMRRGIEEALKQAPDIRAEVYSR